MAQRTDDNVWTKNPIPACATASGGLYLSNSGATCSWQTWRKGSTTQFEPQDDKLMGFGEKPPSYEAAFEFTIGDRVKVPEDLDEGEYVLSFRWDCEQTPQVWNSCSNILITGAEIITK